MSKRKLSEETREKLSRCLGVRGASERAVQELWNICTPEEDHLTRGTFEREVLKELGPWKECISPATFECHDGTTVALPLINFRKAVQQFCHDSQDFRFALQKALANNHKLTPVLYADEATAGNVLSVDKSRKACLYYVSWLECWHLLKNASMWIPVAAVQSQCLNTILGGSSAIMVELLRRIVSPESEEGFAISETATLKQRQRCFFLGDYEGIRAIFSFKGSAGMRPCPLCRNIVKRGSGVVEQDGWFKEISAAEGFISASDKDIFDICDQMSLPSTKKLLESKEVCSGITYNPHTLLWSTERQKMPPSAILFDPLHTYLVNGCASWEVELFVSALYKHTETTREMLQEAVMASKWRSTRSSGKTPNYLKDLFAERMFGDSVYKGQGHQTAAIVPFTEVLPGSAFCCANSNRDCGFLQSFGRDFEVAAQYAARGEHCPVWISQRLGPIAEASPLPHGTSLR